MVPDHFQLYKRILRASSNTRVRILNACVATVTAGSCPTPARPSGVGTVRPVCCCGRRAPTVRPPCCCSTGRRGVIRAERGVCRAAPGTATKPSNRPPSARRTRKRGCPPTSSRCARPSSPPRSRATAARAGPTPPSSPTPPEILQTTPNRESAELRWVAPDDVADLPLHPGFAASWERLRTVTASIPLLVNPAL